MVPRPSGFPAPESRRRRAWLRIANARPEASGGAGQALSRLGRNAAAVFDKTSPEIGATPSRRCARTRAPRGGGRARMPVPPRHGCIAWATAVLRDHAHARACSRLRVAQLARARAPDARGRWFESSHADHPPQAMRTAPARSAAPRRFDSFAVDHFARTARTRTGVRPRHAPAARRIGAPGYGPGGCRFESCRGRQKRRDGEDRRVAARC